MGLLQPTPSMDAVPAFQGPGWPKAWGGSTTSKPHTLVGFRTSKAFSQSQLIPRGSPNGMPGDSKCLLLTSLRRAEMSPPSSHPLHHHHSLARRGHWQRDVAGVKCAGSAVGVSAGQAATFWWPRGEVFLAQGLKAQPPSPTHFLQLGRRSESASGNLGNSVEQSESPPAGFGAESSSLQCGWPFRVAFGKTSYCSGTQFLYLQNKGMISNVPSSSKVKFFKKCLIK